MEQSFLMLTYPYITIGNPVTVSDLTDHGIELGLPAEDIVALKVHRVRLFALIAQAGLIISSLLC